MADKRNVDKEFKDIMNSLAKDNPELAERLNAPVKTNKRAKPVHQNNKTRFSLSVWWKNLVLKCEQQWEDRKMQQYRR